MRAPRPLATVIGLLLLGSVSGCYLFQPRNPQPPSQGGVAMDYSAPDSSLATMARAIEARAGGNSLSAYLGALADSIVNGDRQGFLAFFDPAAVVVWENSSGRVPPAAGDLKLENQLFGSLPTLSPNPYLFSWLNDVDHPHDEVLGPNTMLLHRQYLLVAVPDGAVKDDTLAIGYADLTFIRAATGDKWVIARWQDRVDPDVGPNPPKNKHSFSALRLGRI
jgi:hypothetical protein